MKIKDIKIIPVSFNLKNTFRTTLGQKNATNNLIVTIELENGIKGYGEAAGSLAMAESNLCTMSNIVYVAAQHILNQSILDWKEISQTLHKTYSGHPTAVSSIECALLDAYCRAKKMPLFRFFGNSNRKIETYFTIPALKPVECRPIIQKMAKKGFKKFKIKVTGENINWDWERINLVQSIVAEPSIIVDANQGWKKKECLKFIEKICGKIFSVVLIEQPLPKNDIKGLHFVKKRSPVPIAVDESAHTLKDVKKIVEQDAADVVNIKIAKSGLIESLKIAEYVKRINKKLMIGCMMESKIGLVTSVHWACSTGDFDFIDLDSFLLLKKVPIVSGFQNTNSFLSVKKNILGSGTIFNTD